MAKKSDKAEVAPVAKKENKADAKGLVKKIQKLQVKKNDLKKITHQEALIIAKIEGPKKLYEKDTKYVQKHFETVMKVAAKLQYIKDNELFRFYYNTFEEYLQNEFNYTRSRAYQLIRANQLSNYIDEKVGKEIITTEPQCRELLRLKLYEDVDHQKVDTDKTNEARVKVVKKLNKDNELIKTCDIAKEVDKILAKENDKESKNKTVDSYTQSFTNTCKGVSKILSNIFDNDNLNADDRKAIKDNAILQLNQLVEKLQKDEI